jgi:hypothetical protein
MSDTEKLPRPDFERRGKKASGRVEHDERGNAVWVRSRASDSQEVAIDDSLSIIEEPPKPHLDLTRTAPRALPKKR